MGLGRLNLPHPTVALFVARFGMGRIKGAPRGRFLMDNLTVAREQLEKAIARLEVALSLQSESTGNPAVDKALQEARAEYQNLRVVAENVSGRIGTVIARLQATLNLDGDLGRDGGSSA